MNAEIEKDGKDPRYASVARRIWNDRKVMGLSAPKPNAQTLLFRLLTGPEGASIPGIVAIGEAALAEALGWTLAGFRKAFAELQQHGMVRADWKARLVWLPNAIKHKQNQPTSPNVIVSWKRQWAELPECDLKTEAYHAIRAMVEGIGGGKNEGWLETFDKNCPEPSGKSLPKTIGNQRSEITDPRTGGEAAPRGYRLPEDWEPSPDVLHRFRTQERVDASLRIEIFKNFWLSTTGKNAIKTQWDRAFINWVLKDIEGGRCPRIVGDDLPLLRLPNREELLRADRAAAADMTGVSFGGTK